MISLWHDHVLLGIQMLLNMSTSIELNRSIITIFEMSHRVFINRDMQGCRAGAEAVQGENVHGRKGHQYGRNREGQGR